MDKAKLEDILLSGVCVDIPKDERNANDMMETGVWCINAKVRPECNIQMERVSGEERYTCHYCGAVIEIHFKGH